MKLSITVVALTLGLLFRTAHTASAEEAMTTPAAVQYSVKVQEFEGCECESVCPCVFSQDTTYGDCRGMLVLIFTGTYGSTHLENVPCVIATTHMGKNIEKNMGNWSGILYTSEKTTPAEFEAVNSLLNAMIGDAFATLDQRKAPIMIKSEGDVRDLTLGGIGHLRIHAIKAANGETTKIVNAPSPIAFRELYCAIADENKYDDGTSSWSFTGRNGFFTEFDLANGD